jgi:CDP-diacylglycerol--serine O-phosphatidyltransferase
MTQHHREQGTLPFRKILPNLVTILGLCAGLTSIRFILGGRFELAADLIIVAALIDALDGRLARRLKATSEFGAELDSLSDFLNFGVAPALLVFQAALQGAADAGWIFVLVYVSCCCLRLARFNVTKAEPVTNRLGLKNHFVGVPAPAGAILALLPVFLTFEGILDAASVPLITALYLGLVGAAMVSKLETFSPKSIHVPKEMIVWVLTATVVVVGVMLTRFWLSMILINLIYAGSLLLAVILTIKNKST